MTGKIFACITAVLGSAIVTLAIVIVLVQCTIFAVSIENLPIRVLAVCADLLLGIVVLVGCLYLSTQLAVRILGVGDMEFPPLPDALTSSIQSTTSPANDLPVASRTKT